MGSSPDAVHPLFLADHAGANPALLKLPAAVASEAVLLQLEPLATLGQAFLQLRTLTTAGAAEVQAQARSFVLHLVKPGRF